MKRITSAVSHLIKKHNTRCPYELADRLGIEIVEFSFAKIRGLIFYLGERKIIGVKADLPKHEKRAIVAHEIGHEELHPATVGYFFIKEHTSFVPGKYEHEADLFAAALLVDEPPEYGEGIKHFAARKNIIPRLVKILWEDKHATDLGLEK